MKPKILYHGSPQELMGDRLIPKQATDLGENPENLHKAVYATNIKEVAIVMSILKCEGVGCSSLNSDQKPYGIIYEGWPKQEETYLYFLPSSRFEQDKEGVQWHSFESIKPSKIEKLTVNDNLHLVRKATEKEKEVFFDKYRNKIR